MIPKQLITIWLNDSSEIPDVIDRCIQSHHIDGYQHVLITLSNCVRTPYVERCLAQKAWVKAADYLRLYYLEKYGGIYLDADTEVFGNFDSFLDSRMFVFKEESGYLNNGYIGSEAGHPFLKYVLNTMERNFRADSAVFDSGMQFFAEAYYISDRVGLDMKIYDLSELKKIAHHHGMASWLKQ